MPAAPEDDTARLDRLRRSRADLEGARYSGARRFRDSSGEEVEYRSDAELARAIAALDREIAAITQRPTPSIIQFRTSKGLDR